MNERLPSWLRGSRDISDETSTRALMRKRGVNTVCEEARCPNRARCYKKPTATFLILGDTCTRSCGFCSVNSGKPESLPDLDEPMRIALTALDMGLKHVVVTSVTRDDLKDGGASHFALTIDSLRNMMPEGTSIEVLVPDFKGNMDSVRVVMEAQPDVFNHNIETVPSQYARVRPQAEFSRSLAVLCTARLISDITQIKSGLMLGLGELEEEVVEVLRELRTAGCDSVTIGQYLRPKRDKLQVHRYVRPEEFERFGTIATEMGFKWVVSEPLARSSMDAEKFRQL